MYIGTPSGCLGLRGAAARRSATWPFALVGLRATSHTCDSLCAIAQRVFAGQSFHVILPTLQRKVVFYMNKDDNPSPVSFRELHSGKPGVVEYEDSIGNCIIVWHIKDRIQGFQLNFQEHIFEYNKGRYRYFENTNERSDFRYPATPFTLYTRFTNKNYFRNILEFRSYFINPDWLQYIYQKIEEAVPNPGGV
jgi:hypothetical protein